MATASSSVRTCCECSGIANVVGNESACEYANVANSNLRHFHSTTADSVKYLSVVYLAGSLKLISTHVTFCVC